jgi:hypothetical protein
MRGMLSDVDAYDDWCANMHRGQEDDDQGPDDDEEPEREDPTPDDPGPRCAEDVDGGDCMHCGRPTEQAEEAVCWRCYLEPPAGVPVNPDHLERAGQPARAHGGRR